MTPKSATSDSEYSCDAFLTDAWGVGPSLASDRKTTTSVLRAVYIANKPHRISVRDNVPREKLPRNT